jgi:hypothetical protein
MLGRCTPSAEKISIPGMSEIGARQILLSHGCKPEKLEEYVKQLTERRDYTPSGLSDEERKAEIDHLMKKLGLK